MNLLVHVIDPIDPDEVLPAARFRIVLAQYDAIGSLQAVDSTNVLLSKPTTSMPFWMSRLLNMLHLHSLPTKNYGRAPTVKTTLSL